MSEAMTSEAGWKWYGYGGHFIGNGRCAFKLATNVGGYIVSTVGHWLPKHSDKPETLGPGPADYFETMVFGSPGDDENGDPSYDAANPVACERYADSWSAERGHYRHCRQWAATESEAPHE